MSSAALSLDIADLVARSLGGESVDAAAAGEALAEKYPALGMSGDLIGSAIVRAAGMTRLALQTPALALQPASDIAEGERHSDAWPAVAAPAGASPPAQAAVTADPRSEAADINAAIVSSLERAIAATANAALSIIPAKPPQTGSGNGAARTGSPHRSATAASAERPQPQGAALPSATGPIAAMRRAFFGA